MLFTKYVDKLPIPYVIKPLLRGYRKSYYEIEMREFEQQLHRDLSPTTVWGYDGSYPGPIIEARVKERVFVKWINKLPCRHILPVDKTIHGAEPPNPEVRTVVHLHGGRVEMEDDGYPEAWFTKNFRKVGPFFTKTIYEYPNIQPPTTLWYHDHTLGITRLNVYAGLAGFYFLRDFREKFYRLPRGEFEIPLVIQDRAFNEDGSLFYPSQPDPVPEDGFPSLPNPSIVPEFFGNTILVNGKVWPYLEVEPRKYRFRFLNGSNSRFYRISLTSGQPLIIIGTDQGFLEKPLRTNEITIAPGERVDTILDFSELYGKEIILSNDAPAPFPSGDAPNPETTAHIMQFRVTRKLSGEDRSEIPKCFKNVDEIFEKDSDKRRNLELVESVDEYGRLMLLLQGLRWDDPITTKPKLGSTEIWNLINLTPDTHPIHLHLVRFKILDRRPFNVDIYNATKEIVYTASPTFPGPEESGWKDTVRANPNEVTRIIATFEPFADLYPWHCHILEHEDHEMMRPYKIVDRCPKTNKTKQ